MKLFLVAIVVAATASVAGQTPQPTRPVLGVGNTPCSEWNAIDKFVQNPDGTMTVMRGNKDPVQVSWILGYLSAAGVSGNAAKLGDSYIEGWISGACHNEPQQTLAGVTAELVQDSKTQ
jgi:hypothetical protein